MTEQEPARASSELCVMLGFGAMVCAIPSAAVRGLVLLEEARLRRDGVLFVGEGRFAAWDLASLLGFKERAPRSWVLLSVSHADARVPIALRAGECLEVAPLGSSQPLVPGLFSTRRAAFQRAFNPISRPKLASGVVGLLLDPSGLLTKAELETSLARLAGA